MSKRKRKIPSVNLSISSTPVVAKTRKLKATWTVEPTQDYHAYYGHYRNKPTVLAGGSISDLIEKSKFEFKPIQTGSLPEVTPLPDGTAVLADEPNSYFGMDAEAELTAILSQEIQKEMYAEIVKTLANSIKTVPTQHGTADKWTMSPSGL